VPIGRRPSFIILNTGNLDICSFPNSWQLKTPPEVDVIWHNACRD
jgi:hypothetical protein